MSIIAFFSAVHVLLCVFMIFVILLQPGKDAGMGAALGGGAATSAFGGRGAVTFLGKVTAVCAIGYFLTSLGLSFVGLRQSVTSGESVIPSNSAPVVPAGDTAVEKTTPTEANTPAPVPADEANKGTEAVPAQKLP